MISLTQLIKTNEIRDSLKSIHPKISRRIPCDLIFPCETQKPMLTGTAFDYLLRVEIKRRIPSSELNLFSLGLITIPECLTWSRSDCEKYGLLSSRVKKYGTRSLSDAFGAYHIDTGLVTNILVDLQERHHSVIEEYINDGNSVSFDEVILACIIFAFFDLSNRPSSHLDINIFSKLFPTEQIQLINLMSIVPQYFFDYGNLVLLNPALGSRELGIGADCDIIIDNNLIDIKTVSRGSVTLDHLNQLFGYFVLSRQMKRRDNNYPDIEQVSIYFSRYGYLWTMSTDEWLNSKDFYKVERLILDYNIFNGMN